MSTSDNCKDGLSKSNDSVCEMNDMLQNMSTRDADDKVNVCANCGKEGDDVNNICNKCKVVKYCNATCKKKHKKKHKKDCEEHVKLAAEKHEEELRIAAELHDEKLFKQSPPKDDCPNYLHFKQGIDIRHVAEKSYVMDVHMLLYLITKAIKLIIKSVLFAELQSLLLKRKQSKE